ncbi:Dual specificity mitogen-activated protein kinase kinase 7 [Dermatophagoides pteronyssinus]|uniref:Dual specificity mitogen-activated protein kinase kinase 7 n=1 Tax=Dermatophagoides pteronyssinus TaxID=6956 RepID=A0ABQ8JA77_DERPT|nr:Dual specificity mitogen-activated protein kinase kinase 7 [Dermatophagoides pteronyssinus]
MEFFGKFTDHLKGWFQNQRPSSSSSMIVRQNSSQTNMSSGSIQPQSTPQSARSSSAKNDKLSHFLIKNNAADIQCTSTTSLTMTTTTTTMIRSPNALANNTPIRISLKPTTTVNNNSPSLTIKSPHLHQQQVLPPSSLSLSSSHWSTSRSPDTPGGTTTLSTMNPVSPTNASNHHHHPTYNNNYHNNTPPYYQYNRQQQQPNNHSLDYGYQMHYSNNQSTASSSSSTTSFGGQVPLTPGPYNASSIGIGPSSYSAINTPDSPVNFRRQYSLNVNQRGGHHSHHYHNNNNSSGGNASRLQLDLRSHKNSPAYQQQSASTDLIDKHSLSPRPRPKDLSLSNSQDNMLKQMDGHHNSSRFGDVCSGGAPNRIPKPLKLKASLSSSSNVQNRSQPRPCDGLFDNPNGSNNSNNHYHHSNKQNYHHDSSGKVSANTVTNSSGRVGSARCTASGVSTPHSVYYQNRLELSRNSFLLTIGETKFENVKESDFLQIRELGAGSFAQVCKMLHRPSNVHLAVKKMRRSGNPDEIRHIQRDRDLLQKSNHEHVVQCYGYLILETEIWIFMELMATCFDRLIKHLSKRNETVPERIIGKVAVATIDALDYLKKELQAIHRDIKPSNILINDQGIIKLCDFGISGYLIDSKAHTRTVGSTPYMAPERIQPPSDGTYDIRSDIWSMGITLIEIATGQFPYKDWSSIFEILSIVIQQEPPRLPDDKGFSEDFKSFIKAW